MKAILKTLSVIGLIFGQALPSNAQNITVSLGGNSAAGYNGEGQPSYLTNMNGPYDVCIDQQHNIYFSDSGNREIRKISASTGIVTLVAGGGSDMSDGVPATSASVEPFYMCIDHAGNIYFSADAKIRRIDATTGLISTVAGTGLAGYGGDNGPATNAQIQGYRGICLDANENLLIADGSNNRIRKLDKVTGTITTIAGTGTAGYSGNGLPATAAQLDNPQVITADAVGNIYIVDQGCKYMGAVITPIITYDFCPTVIRKINAAGIIDTFAGTLLHSDPTSGVLAKRAYLGNLSGLCADTKGDIITDEISCSIRVVDSTSDTISTVTGSFTVEGYVDNVNAFDARLNHPHGICVDETGSIYIVDTHNNRIRKSIQLTHTPSFVYRKGQTILDSTGGAVPVDPRLAIVDVDSAQVETWTALSTPLNGSLNGFPYSGTSYGIATTTVPNGLTYTPNPSFVGTDSFKVRVNDGALADTITIYVNVLHANLVNSVATQNLGNSNSLTVTPNPSNSQCIIYVKSDLTEATHIVITNAAGQIVKEMDGMTNQTLNTVLDVRQGIYFVQAKGEHVNLNCKWVRL